MANARGVIPKRSEERTRRNKPENEGKVAIKRGEAFGVSAWPKTPEDWDPRAQAWLNSLKQSGMSQWYELSDIHTALFVGEALNRWMKDGGLPRGVVTEILNGMAVLGTTEAERRRMRIELSLPEAEKEDPADAVKSRTRKALTAPVGGKVVQMYGS